MVQIKLLLCWRHNVALRLLYNFSFGPPKIFEFEIPELVDAET